MREKFIYRFWASLFYILVIFFFKGEDCWGSNRDTLDLSGRWEYRLVGAPSSIPGEGHIQLPATLDHAHKSIYNPESDNTTQLRREFSFTGEASYSKKIEIPSHWKGKDIELYIERTKPTTLKIDGKEVGFNSRISSPQRYDLTSYLFPGTHEIEIIVNNTDSIPPIVARSSHAVSESTQTNWNGILGTFALVAKDNFNIKNVLIDENELPRFISFEILFSQPAPSNLTMVTIIDGKKVKTTEIIKGNKSANVTVPAKGYELWSAKTPVLHDLKFQISDNQGKLIDNFELTTGFRKFSSNGEYFTINENPIFLRGTVNTAVFPLTGYAPVDLDSWLDYFATLREYGLNHVRFHSWTPPEAAFRAADITGIYIMTELPIWGELDRDLNFHNKFLKEDMKGIMQQYAAHPSFVLFSNGNELWGDISLMGEYMKEAKQLNPRILSTYGSNVYLGMNGQIGEEDFIVASKTGDEMEKAVRGSMSFADTSTGGHFNSTYPGSNSTFSEATAGLSVPLISHEVGQYQSYPDFSEIEKYTGDLKPDNLVEFKKRAEEAGTYRKYKEFHNASGKWVAKLMKAEMEMAQRSPGISGFQLFGLQDYPGQGTALVGILDPFMKSKGFITPQDWKKSSEDLAIFAEFPKFTFTSGEPVEIPLVSLNFTSNPDSITTILWATEFDKGSVEAIPGLGIIENESIFLKMPKLSEPKRMNLYLQASGSGASNDYNFWVYPTNIPEVDKVKQTENLTEALILLDQGERVILCPDSSTVAEASIGPLFTPDFWNYRMFRSICDEMNIPPSPGTLGLYIQQYHPSLKKFPSDDHTDWQWYPIVANSRPIVYDRLPKDFDPIIEVIDNVERNFRLALMLECNVGKGKLILLSVDPKKISEYPEGRWFLQSIKEYAASKDFKPSITLTPDQVVNLVTKPSTARLVKQLKNETYNSHW